MNERPYYHGIDREPYRAPPVGITPEEAGGGFGGHILDLILLAVDFEYIGVFLVVAGDRAYPVIAQELVFVEHLREHALELVFVEYG